MVVIWTLMFLTVLSRIPNIRMITCTLSKTWPVLAFNKIFGRLRRVRRGLKVRKIPVEIQLQRNLDPEKNQQWMTGAIKPPSREGSNPGGRRNKLGVEETDQGCDQMSKYRIQTISKWTHKQRKYFSLFPADIPHDVSSLITGKKDHWKIKETL